MANRGDKKQASGVSEAMRRVLSSQPVLCFPDGQVRSMSLRPLSTSAWQTEEKMIGIQRIRGCAPCVNRSACALFSGSAGTSWQCHVSAAARGMDRGDRCSAPAGWVHTKCRLLEAEEQVLKGRGAGAKRQRSRKCQQASSP